MKCSHNVSNLLIFIVSDDGPELMQDVNKLFTFFKSKANKEKELMEYLENLEGLGETQKEFLNRIFIEERQKLIDTQKLNFYKNLPILRTFNWRFEVEVSSRERKKSFIPNFLMNFGFIKYGKVKEDGEQEEIVSDLCVNSDFGTLEKVHQDFKDITHFPRSISYRKMTRGVQRLADQF